MELAENEKIKLSVDLDSMKFGELELFEEVTGRSLDDLVRMKPVIDPETGKYKPDPNDPKGRPLMQAEMTTKALMAMVLIALRRDNKDVSIDEVRELRLDQIDFDVKAEVDDIEDDSPKETTLGDSESAE